MEGKSLGIIETIGFVPAVEAADAAVKSANVTLEGLRRVGAGLVSVLMTGDVGSVKASIDAAKTAAQRLGKVKSVTVIARTAQGLETLFENQFPDNKMKPLRKIDPEVQAGETAHISKGAGTGIQKDEYENMTVAKLRRLARTMEDFSIAGDKIKYARKQALVQAIFDHYRQNEEEPC